jgi:aminoglycoside phosphotransferase (APT) family kinase protein
MRTRPGDISDAELIDALRRHWAIRAGSLEYRPVGAGSHHWVAIDSAGPRWFLTVDDLEKGRIAESPDEAFDVLGRAWRAVHWLQGEGIEFAVGPVPPLGVRLAPRYALCVFPYVEGEPLGPGGYENDDDRRRVEELLARLHGLGPCPVAGRDDFAVPGRRKLQLAMNTDAGWDAGPYSGRARELLSNSRDGVAEEFRRYDELVDRVRQSPERMVLTHGEPHSANVLRQRDGQLLLIDWDTMLIAPPERDFAMVGGSGDADALRMYHRWWGLAEICEYVDRFRRPHNDDEDHRAAWADLQNYLPV